LPEFLDILEKIFFGRRFEKIISQSGYCYE
jgi:hypothetical protein